MDFKISPDDPSIAIFEHYMCLTPEIINQLINKKITGIEFSENFNNPIDALPDTITYINFDPIGCFSQLINKFPNNLQILHLPKKFNHPIDNLPQSLKELSFLIWSSQFNKPLNNLPLNLVSL
jgi:hypothetical protein